MRQRLAQRIQMPGGGAKQTDPLPLMRQRIKQRRYRFSLPGLRMLYTGVITTDKEIMAATADRRVRQQIQRRMQLFKLLQRRQGVINDPLFCRRPAGRM